MRGLTFYQLHLLLDKHAAEQLPIIDAVAERVQTLGGVAVRDPRHAVQITSIPRPPPDGVGGHGDAVAVAAGTGVDPYSGA